jgi:hypothetical protein
LPRSREEVKAEYLKRRDAYLMLVGWLYPSIVYNELMALVDEYGQPNDLPSIGPPYQWDYVDV